MQSLSNGPDSVASRPTSSSFGGTWADLADREDDDDDLGDDPLPEAWQSVAKCSKDWKHFLKVR